mmetsp:Transcript_650/g.1951  ORF Transcript_650/g.1951 Transcript_650/m.1951 type:complete len:568 (+) Transcript_650:564-2267(+)
MEADDGRLHRRIRVQEVRQRAEERNAVRAAHVHETRRRRKLVEVGLGRHEHRLAVDLVPVERHPPPRELAVLVGPPQPQRPIQCGDEGVVRRRAADAVLVRDRRPHPKGLERAPRHPSKRLARAVGRAAAEARGVPAARGFHDLQETVDFRARAVRVREVPARRVGQRLALFLVEMVPFRFLRVAVRLELLGFVPGVRRREADAAVARAPRARLAHGPRAVLADARVDAVPGAVGAPRVRLVGIIRLEAGHVGRERRERRGQLGLDGVWEHVNGPDQLGEQRVVPSPEMQVADGPRRERIDLGRLLGGAHRELQRVAAGRRDWAREARDVLEDPRHHDVPRRQHVRGVVAVVAPERVRPLGVELVPRLRVHVDVLAPRGDPRRVEVYEVLVVAVGPVLRHVWLRALVRDLVRIRQIEVVDVVADRVLFVRRPRVVERVALALEPRVRREVRAELPVDDGGHGERRAGAKERRRDQVLGPAPRRDGRRGAALVARQRAVLLLERLGERVAHRVLARWGLLLFLSCCQFVWGCPKRESVARGWRDRSRRRPDGASGAVCRRARCSLSVQ